VLEDEPGDAQALASLDVLYGRLGRWEPYVDVLRRRIELDLGEFELVDLKFRLGGYARESTWPTPPAHSKTTARSCSSTAARGGASRSRTMLTGPLRTEAAAILESIYEERDDWPKLIHALEILGAGETRVDRRVALKRKAARIGAERANDAKHAFTVLASALRDDPALAETRDEIEPSPTLRELSASSSPSTPSLRKASDPALARDYWLRIAGIHDRLGDVDLAARRTARCWRSIQGTPTGSPRSSNSSRELSAGRTSSASSSDASTRRTI
jgi:hypothetical protein